MINLVPHLRPTAQPIARGFRVTVALGTGVLCYGVLGCVREKALPVAAQSDAKTPQKYCGGVAGVRCDPGYHCQEPRSEGRSVVVADAFRDCLKD